MKLLAKRMLGNRREWMLIAFVMVLMSCYYLSHLTVSGLWYDEGIEYFYSKYMVGSLPIGGYWENMYRRVCFTMQPPLYNILMYFWLLFFDTEFGFRFAGVFTTFVGGVGLYCSLRKTTNMTMALVGLFVYLSSASVVFYAMECAEYNLLLCMECWMLYFFISSIYEEEWRKRKKSLMGFYIFATMSIYSQYGAVFLIIALFIALLSVYARRKDTTSIKWLVGLGIITFVVAIVPLWFLFVQKQIALQGSSSVDHHPVFVKNLFYSIVVSLSNSMSWIFNRESIDNGGMTAVVNVMVLVSVACSLFAVFQKKSKGIYKACIVALIVSWGAFFFASAYSYYAYNGFLDTFGCENIIRGSRYILFFAPLLIFTLTVGVYLFCNSFCSKDYFKKIILVGAVAVPLVFYVRLWLQKVEIKDDVRETTLTWIKSGGYRSHTLVQEWAAGAFYFYFSHSPIFCKETADRIIMTYMEIRKTDTKSMSAYLESLGTFSYSDLYYVGSRTMPGSPNNLELIKETFKQKGYNVETVGEEKNSVVLHLIKD